MLDVDAELTKVAVDVALVEWVLLRRENHFLLVTLRWSIRPKPKGDWKKETYLQLFAHTRGTREVDSVVLNPQEFVHHSLVGPLVKQRRHGVVAAIKQ
jgi:hypothetical protein